MLAAVTTDPRPSLRERKKLATRRDLAHAALRLALERGMDNVLTEDIAAAAGVSARTFNNYFSSKYDAICSLALDRAERTGAALRARPAAEPLAESLVAVFLEQYAAGDHDQQHGADWMAGLRMAMHCPPLRAEVLRIHRAAQDTLAAAIADRIGAGPEPDPDTAMLCQIIAGAANAATQAALERWLRADPPPSLPGLMRTAMCQLTEDLPAHLAARDTPRSNLDGE